MPIGKLERQKMCHCHWMRRLNRNADTNGGKRRKNTSGVEQQSGHMKGGQDERKGRKDGVMNDGGQRRERCM